MTTLEGPRLRERQNADIFNQTLNGVQELE